MMEEDIFTLMDLCSMNLVQAIQVSAPSGFPYSAKRAMRFLIEKSMEAEGIKLPIVFTETDGA